MAILLAGALGGCAERTARNDVKPPVALQDAISRTLEASSFHIDVTIEVGRVTETGQIDYVAPDRFRSIEYGGGGSATRIVVGADVYDSPAAGSPFMVSTIPEFSLPELIPPLDALRTVDDVRFVDGSYRFTVSDSIGQFAGDGEARVEAGVLDSVSFDFGKIEMRLKLSGYGEDFVIDAPNVDASNEMSD